MIAGSSITLPPVAGLLRLLDVGAGKPHARVRSSSHVQVNVPYRIGDGCACTCLGSTLASLCLCFLRSSCFPGNLVVRACEQVRLLVVGCWLFVLARIAVLCSLPLLNHHHHCVHHYHYHYHH
jgi:hypothetical protein